MYSENGVPGSKFVMSQHLTGFSSGSQTPLILVDNFPVSSDELNFHAGDIEEIVFLPGGIASSFYGWDAGNGVIMINTHKQNNKFSISYQSRGAVMQLVNPIENFNASSFRALIAEKFSDNPAAMELPGDSETDWQKEIYRSGLGQDHYMSASGTNFKIPWRASVGYTGATGIVKTSEYQRTIAGISIYPAFFRDHLKVNLNLNGTFINNRLANQKAIGAAVFMDPTQQIYADNDFGGYFAYLFPSSGRPNPIAPSNPVALIEQSDFGRKSEFFFGNLDIGYRFHFLPDLRIGLKASYRNLGHDYLDVSDSLAAWTYFGGQGGRVTGNFGTNTATFLNPVLNYTTKIKSINSNIDISAGSIRSFIEDKYTSYQRVIQGNLLVDSIRGENSSITYSFFGFMQGSVMDRYLINFGYSIAGSSRFSEDNRSEGYPSLGLAWKVKQEPFSRNFKFIDEFTLHFNFSVSPGGLNNFYSNASVSKSKGYQGSVTDLNLKHERYSATEYGVRFSLLKDRISGSFVVYNQLIKRMILPIPIANGTNFNNFIFANAGEVERKGYNLVMNVRVLETDKMALSLGFNLNHGKNKITSLKSGNSPYTINTGQISGGVGNFIMQQREGYPLNSFFVFSQVYDTDGNPLEGVYCNFSGEPGDVAQNEKNKYLYEKPDPDFVIGLNANLSYLGWKLGFTGRLVTGNYIYNNTASMAFYQAIDGSVIYFLRNIPVSVQESGFVTPQYFSDYYIENASFFRFDNIHLGYTFTRLSKLNANLEVFASVQNALVVTNYTGQDPEVSGGIDNFQYPRPRIWTLGLNFNF
ncbi:MAG: hypothetical protein IPH20_02940 [Bacteroidales bacterium]|nr:hypothetical protein [Bacteroidales bacterium]